MWQNTGAGGYRGVNGDKANENLLSIQQNCVAARFSIMVGTKVQKYIEVATIANNLWRQLSIMAQIGWRRTNGRQSMRLPDFARLKSTFLPPHKAETVEPESWRRDE